MVFKKGGRLAENLNIYYENSELEIVNRHVYVGIVFTTGGSFFEAQKTLAGQSLKAIFHMNTYLCEFTIIYNFSTN